MVKKLGTKNRSSTCPYDYAFCFVKVFFPSRLVLYDPILPLTFFFSLVATPSENSNLNKRNDYQMLLKYMYRLREAPIHIILLYYYCFL